MPSIFTKGHIAYMMDRVLDRPMPAPQPFDCRCSGFFGKHTYQSIAHLSTVVATLEHHTFTVPSHHLLHLGPVHILDMRSATRQRACLQASMALLGGRSDHIPNLVVGWVRWQTEAQVQIRILGSS